MNVDGSLHYEEVYSVGVNMKYKFFNLSLKLTHQNSHMLNMSFTITNCKCLTAKLFSRVKCCQLQNLHCLKNVYL